MIEKLDKYFYNLFKLENFSTYTDKAIYLLSVLTLIIGTIQFYRILDVLVVKVPCWAFFQSCGFIQNFVLMNNIPEYRPMYFAFMFLLYFLVLYFLYKQKYGLSFALACGAFFINLFPYFIFTDDYNAVISYYNHYFFYTCLILFFGRHSRKELLAVFVALTYLFPGYSKLISEFWVVGIISMPYIPSSLLPLATNLIIITQLIFPFLLLFGNRTQKIITVVFLELYHAYSATLPTVSFNFFFYNGPLLVLLFLESNLKINREIFKKNILVTAIIIIFIFLSNVRILIPGNDTLTKEGIYGINVFAAPYTEETEYQDKDMKVVQRNRGIKEFNPFMQLRQIKNPEIRELSGYNTNLYVLLSRIKENCVDERPRYLKLSHSTFYSSYKIVDVQDYCHLEYKGFSHNSWININPEVDEDLSMLNELQRFLHDNRGLIEFGYTIMFYLVIFFGVYKFLKD